MVELSLARSPRRVAWGTVITHYFGVELDRSKLPSSGCAPIGLGSLLASDPPEALDVFEERRDSARRTAIGLLLGHGSRLAMLEDGSSDAAELANDLAEVEGENARILAGDGGSDAPPPGSLASKVCAGYGTALPGEKRLGAAGGFRELDDDEEDRRKRRRDETKQATEERKAERRRCDGCRRFACLC